ncbi:hypothetical protein MK786_14300 [Microbacterium sp. CFH 31415]|uniref:hypothetical protein n=1 Tax=Microbacterium sp. CFH 31415 TaxID=2921732 RepID=UPI001F137037|nr:hypothetical protein [Microbacterium sp. CFH 31415]MCH6231919.1 hypothetical protein [Microbacterium sp. CFH 31415]
MVTTLSPETGADPAGRRPHGKTAARVGVTFLVVALVGLVVAALVLFAWMVNEEHFDRPSAEFDELASVIDTLPGVDSVQKERWVEAPTFSNPTSWMAVTVDQAGLPGLLDAACTTGYPDAVLWSFHVRTPSGTDVSVNGDSPSPSAVSGGTRCPDFGFDAVEVVDELDRVAPGLAVQPARWDETRFAFVEVEEARSAGFGHLLPLVAHAADLVAAAGLDSGTVVEINSSSLGVAVPPDEGDRYLALLTELADEHAVNSFWADGRETNGQARVQIVAPETQHAAIEELLRASGLDIADLPVRFLEQ